MIFVILILMLIASSHRYPGYGFYFRPRRYHPMLGYGYHPHIRQRVFGYHHHGRGRF